MMNFQTNLINQRPIKVSEVRTEMVRKSMSAIVPMSPIKVLGSEMRTFEMEITPAQAREFLSNNISNRPLRMSWIKTLASVIERGEWKVTHQGIALTPDNRLLDGQHRLHAIVLSDVTVRMQVSFDCDPESFAVLDGGIKRTTADHLGVSGMEAAIGRLLWKLPDRTSGATPSSIQISEVLRWSKCAMDSVLSTVNTKTKFSSAAILMPIVVHVMDGALEVLPKLIVLRMLNFDDMPPSIKSLTKQIIEGKTSTRLNTWDLSARVWRAFNPDGWNSSKVTVKDIDISVKEMNEVTTTYRKTRSAI